LGIRANTSQTQKLKKEARTPLSSSRKQTELAQLNKLCSTTIIGTIPVLMHDLRNKFRSGNQGTLSVAQFRILGNVYRNGTRTSRDLSDHIGVSLPAISRMVDVLVNKGFIQRLPSIHDRRQTPLRVTPKGRRYYVQSRSFAEKSVTHRISQLDDSKKHLLIEALSILRQTLL